jgi:hypothetical protein
MQIWLIFISTLNYLLNCLYQARKVSRPLMQRLSFLVIHPDIDSEGRLRTKLYDKRDDLNFPIVNFPFICSNIPAASYGLYISQFRVCGFYHDSLDIELLLTWKLLRTFYGRQHDLVKRYGISVSQMTTDMFHL